MPWTIDSLSSLGSMTVRNHAVTVSQIVQLAAHSVLLLNGKVKDDTDAMQI